MEIANPYLVCSSLLFTVPLTLTAYNRQWLAYSACLLILATSLVHHSMKHNITYIIDITACHYLAVVSLFYGFRYNVIYTVIPGTTYAVIVHYVGYQTKSLLFGSNTTFWNASIHLAIALSISYTSNSLGHIKNDV